MVTIILFDPDPSALAQVKLQVAQLDPRRAKEVLFLTDAVEVLARVRSHPRSVVVCNGVPAYLTHQAEFAQIKETLEGKGFLFLCSNAPGEYAAFFR